MMGSECQQIHIECYGRKVYGQMCLQMLKHEITATTNYSDTKLESSPKLFCVYRSYLDLLCAAAAAAAAAH